MITLKSNRMRVEIAEPGEAPADGFRFDHAGFITDVILDGTVHFCANEPRNLCHPTSGGRGLCCEYATDVSSEAAPGEWYPKFGVGLLRKNNQGYVFYRRYPDAIPFPVTVNVSALSADFVTSPLPALGYALETKRHIEVLDTSLLMVTSVRNLGSRPVSISEYCHNLLSVDGMALSPDYHLLLPTLPDRGTGEIADAYGKHSDYLGDGRGVTFARHGASGAYLHVALDGMDAGQPFSWTLKHDGARAGVTGEVSFRPEKVDLWSADHIISPEVFHSLTLAVGEHSQWRRRWTFFAEDPFGEA